MESYPLSEEKDTTIDGLNSWIMARPFYRGFSTTLGQPVSGSATFDSELIKADLLVQFNTDLGEVPGRAGFGSILRTLAYQPFDDVTENAIIAEVRRVVNNDPRVSILQMNVTTDRSNSGIAISMDLFITELGQQVTFDYFINSTD